MKDTFRNIVSYEKLRRLRTKTKGTSLLILTAVGAVLFATLTFFFARSYLSNGSIQSSIATLTRLSKPPVPLSAIHMLDKAHGWALTDTSVLKTSDGGLHWTEVAAPHSPSPFFPVMGTFMDEDIAWVVGGTRTTAGRSSFAVECTSDGGLHWQNAQFSDSTDGISGLAIDPPHFINKLEGWLVVRRDYSTGTKSIDSDLFHTTDGGKHWSITPYPSSGKVETHFIPTGISVDNAENIYSTLAVQTSELTEWPAFPIVNVTRDGGKTWQQQQLPPVSGLDAHTVYGYKIIPPVFFGNYGMMPVEFGPPNDASKLASGLSIYVTNDGIHWSSRPAMTLSDSFAFSAYVQILDQQHIWVVDINGSIHESQNGGQSWNMQGSVGKQYSLDNTSNSNVADVSFTDPNTGWIVQADNNGNSSRLLHSTDGGHTWRQIRYSIQ